MTGEIPQSNALSEATTDSLAELFSRDPEGLTRQDRDRIIESLRAQRARIESVDRASPVKAPKAAGSKLPLAGSTSKTTDDLGL